MKSYQSTPTTEANSSLYFPTFSHAFPKKEENDPIVREIDLYISPSLSNTLHLIQFPLIPTSLQHRDGVFDHQLSNPSSVNFKPKNGILKLEFPIPKSLLSSQRNVPAILDLKSRVMESTEVNLVSHIALGIFRDYESYEKENQIKNSDYISSYNARKVTSKKSSIVLLPLSHILQLRPSFAHVDDLFENLDITHRIDSPGSTEAQPLLFTKQESERAEQSRLSSYAYHKSIEDAEEWIKLHSISKCSDTKLKALKNINQIFTKGNLHVSRDPPLSPHRVYIRSLNYLPHVLENNVDNYLKEERDRYKLEENERQTDVVTKRQRHLTELVTNLIQNRDGMPFTYSALRCRFPENKVADEELIEALSSSSVLIRGNFVPKSFLSSVVNHEMEVVRDCILILMNKWGIVRRDWLFCVFGSKNTTRRKNIYMPFCKDEKKNKINVPGYIINYILDNIGCKRNNGTEMKINDNILFHVTFSRLEIIKKHSEYWERKEKRYKEYIISYEDLMFKKYQDKVPSIVNTNTGPVIYP